MATVDGGNKKARRSGLSLNTQQRIETYAICEIFFPRTDTHAICVVSRP